MQLYCLFRQQLAEQTLQKEAHLLKYFCSDPMTSLASPFSVKASVVGLDNNIL